MRDCNSATDRHVCSTVQDNASNTITVRGERLLLLVCIVGLASCSDHAEHCKLCYQAENQGTSPPFACMCT